MLVNFWASWCEPCRNEAPALEDFHRAHPNRFTVLGINLDDNTDDASAFVEEYGLTYPQLRDGDGRERRDAYGMTGFPESFLVDPEGRIALIRRGPVDETYLAEYVDTTAPGGRAQVRLVAGILALALLAPAAAAGQQASLPDIEDEVMCPICGTTLELSDSPQAERERELIRGLIAEGKSKDEIKDALVAEYGEDVLAVPGLRGLRPHRLGDPGAGHRDRRRRRSASRSPGWRAGGAADGVGRELEPGDAARLERDMSSYDL